MQNLPIYLLNPAAEPAEGQADTFSSGSGGRGEMDAGGPPGFPEDCVSFCTQVH